MRPRSLSPSLQVIKMYILLVERVLAMIGERISPLRTSPAGSTVGNFLTFQNFKAGDLPRPAPSHVAGLLTRAISQEYNGRERAVVAAMLCDEEQLRNHKSYAFYLKLKGIQPDLPSLPTRLTPS